MTEIEIIAVLGFLAAAALAAAGALSPDCGFAAEAGWSRLRFACGPAEAAAGAGVTLAAATACAAAGAAFLVRAAAARALDLAARAAVRTFPAYCRKAL